MQFINKKDVCAGLHISGDTFDKWAGLGLPTYRIGRLIFVRRDDVDTFIESHGQQNVATIVNDIMEQVA